MSPPVVVLVPGSFALPEFYDELFSVVRADGVEIKGLHKPSVGLTAGEGRPDIPPPTMYDDAAYIAGEVEKLADQGRDVILLGHSYGGVPVSESTKGLSKKQRQTQGKKGGLIALGYLTCLVPEVGGSAVDVLSHVPDDYKTPMNVGDDGWMSQWKPETTAAIIMQTQPIEVATNWVKTFPKHSAVSFTNPLTYPGYKEVPVSYLFCELDKCIPPEVQQQGIDIIEKASGSKVHVTKIKADHCPNFTATPETAAWIVDLVKRHS